MINRLLSIVLLSTALFAQNPAATPPPNFDGNSWWAYVKVLASDQMEGRETGSEGLRKSAAYIVDQLKADGLQPAGSNGFYQPVKFVSRQIDESGSSLALVRNGKDEPLVLGEDAMFSTRVDLAPQVNAPLVFVGYGLRVPEKDYDDFAGLDVKGKVVVVISGSPADMPSALASHYQSTSERAKSLRAAGAVGMISDPEPGIDGHSMEPHEAGAHASQHGAGRSQPRRIAGHQAAGHIQSGGCREAVRRLRPHLPGDRRPGQRPQASADLPADHKHSCKSQGHQEAGGV